MRHRVASLLLALLCHAGFAAESTPNIVLIMTDDMGWADLTSYGAPDIRTPNIDSIARDGVRMTDFYSNGVLCSPTRAGLISGRYQQRYGLEVALPCAFCSMFTTSTVRLELSGSGNSKNPRSKRDSWKALH